MEKRWSYRELKENKEKNSFCCTVNILITFNCRNVKVFVIVEP